MKNEHAMTYPQRNQNSPVLCWREGGVAHIRFNRPGALNAVDVTMAQQFRQCCERVRDDTAVRAVVMSGEGRAFMAGGDVAAMNLDPVGVASRLIEGLHAGIEALSKLAAPVIVSVHGAVAGGGLGLALSCDLCIAAQSTRLSFAYPMIGASSDCATSWALPRLVGLRKAMEIALLNETLDASEALRLGLVNRVVPDESLVEATQRLAQRLAEGPTEAFGRQKRLLRESLGRGLHDQLHAEAQDFLACVGSTDFAEGTRAFVEKRPPLFKGC